MVNKISFVGPPEQERWPVSSLTDPIHLNKDRSVAELNHVQFNLNSVGVRLVYGGVVIVM